MKIKNLFYALLALPLFFVACNEDKAVDQVKDPTVKVTAMSTTETSVQFIITSTDATKVAYLVVEGSDVPNAAEILTNGKAADANVNIIIKEEGLKESTEYVVAVAAQNNKATVKDFITMTTKSALNPDGPGDEPDQPGDTNKVEFTATHITTEYQADGSLHYYYFELGDNTWNGQWGVDGGTYYSFGIVSATKGNGVLPNGTYSLASSYSANTIIDDYSYRYQMENGDMVNGMETFKDANLVITDGKIEANIEMPNGEIHHVVFEGALTVGDGGTQVPVEFEATHTANKWYWGGSTANWGNKYSVNGEGFSIDVHFPAADATETTLSTGLYTWCTSDMFNYVTDYRQFTTRTFTVNGTSVAVDTGTALVEAEDDVYHIEMTLQGRDGFTYMIEYNGKLNDKGEVGETDTNLVINTLSKGSIYNEYLPYIIKFVAEGENFSFDLLLNNETAKESQIVAGDYGYVTSKGNLNTPGYFYIENFYLDGTKYTVSGASLSVVTEDTKNVELTLNIATADGSEFVVTYTGLVGGNEDEPTTPTEPTKLATPSVSGVVAGNAATISWQLIDGAKDYTVTLNGTDVQNVSTTYIVYNNLEYDTTYSVSVVANSSDEALYITSDAGTATFTTEAEGTTGGDEGGNEGGNEGGDNTENTATMTFIKDYSAEYGAEYSVLCYYEITSGDDVIGFTMFNAKSDKKSLYDGTYQQVNSLNTLISYQSTSVYIDKVVIDGENNGGAQGSSTLVISENGTKITLNLDYNVINEGVKTRTYVCNGVN